jgi:hypothetical protein
VIDIAAEAWDDDDDDDGAHKTRVTPVGMAVGGEVELLPPPPPPPTIKRHISSSLFCNKDCAAVTADCVAGGIIPEAGIGSDNTQVDAQCWFGTNRKRYRYSEGGDEDGRSNDNSFLDVGADRCSRDEMGNILVGSTGTCDDTSFPYQQKKDSMSLRRRRVVSI